MLGERWRIGTSVLSPVDVRIPCNDFKGWLGLNDLRQPGLGEAVHRGRAAGAYLRVLEEGHLQAGDEIVVEDRPEHGVTVSTMFRALTTEPDLLPLLIDVPGLAGARLRAGPRRLRAGACRSEQVGQSGR